MFEVRYKMYFDIQRLKSALFQENKNYFQKEAFNHVEDI